MKSTKGMKKLKIGSGGITLIALVITIIVLLILAGISIMMLTGNNSILNRAGQAAEETDKAQIKERAEIAKLGVQIDHFAQLKDISVLKKNAIVSAIEKEFGVSATGNKVTTSDGKWDILVKNDLSIDVIKHKNSNKEITVSFGDIQETESRAFILTVVIETKIDGETMDYRRYATELLDNTEDEEELKQIVVDGYNYALKKEYESMGITEFEEITWEQLLQITGESTTEGFMNVFGNTLIDEGIIGQPKYNETYGTDVTISCDGESQIINTALTSSVEFTLTNAGKEYEVKVVDSDGNETIEIANVLSEKEEKYSEIYLSNTVEEIEGYKVTIPAGFAKGISENVGKISTGLVITDSVDSDGYSNGNEFVWIPVTTPVADEEIDGTTNKAMCVKIGDNYRGLLYNFEGVSSTVRSGCTTTTKNYREPDVIRTDSDEEFESYGITIENIQKEYNKMIESVKKNKGFYIARYEMGIENENAISKINIMPTIGYNWYELYEYAKTYSNNENSVTSSMIWGSQYDAMLNFALQGNDKSKVTGSGNGTPSYRTVRTGLTKTKDVINNIYDLEGNYEETSQEADSDVQRVERGRDAYNLHSPYYRFSSTAWPKHDRLPRLAIYVK